tara:strand:+ start:229 stop:807 length:579 start_codon:yes stop_codon:yes gene_type:complete
MVDGINPESELESRIINSEAFKIASAFSKSKGEGHPEKNMGVHMGQILEFIDVQNWEDYRTDLRLLGLLHDLGKPLTNYDENGNLVGSGHAVYSVEIAKKFVSDEDFLELIRIHDKYFHFSKDDGRGKFKQDKFLRMYGEVNLDLLTRFNYADSNNRENDSVKWFEDKLYELKLKNDKVYGSDLVEPEHIIG